MDESDYFKQNRRVMRCYLVFLSYLTLFINSVVGQQSFQTVVRVSDFESKQPLSNVTVILNEKGFQSETTDYNGKAVFKGVVSRRVSFTIHFQGFSSIDTIFNISQDEMSNNFSVKLKKVINKEINDEDLSSDGVRELFQKKVENEVRLRKKYPFGFVLFGNYDGNMIWDPKLNDTDPRISASWKDTEIIIYRDQVYFDLKIFGLKWLKENKKLKSTISINVGEYHIPKQRIPQLGSEIRVSHLVEGDVDVYFELLESAEKVNFSFVLGFKK